MDEAGDRADALIKGYGGGAKRREEELTRRLVAIGPEVIPHLCDLLRQRPEDVPTGAVALALGNLGGEEAVEALQHLLASPQDRKREAAVVALGSTRSELALGSLLSALEDRSARVRLAAPASLSRVASAVESQDLVDLLTERLQRSETKDAYALALAALDRATAREALYELLERWADPRTVLAVLSGLWGTPREGDGRVVHALLVDCREPAICKKAGLLLGRLRYVPATRDLLDLLYEDDEGMVNDVHWALMQITGLRLKADPELWESWWEGHSEQAG